MNQYFEDRWIESIRRLALGIECTDPLTRMRIGHPLIVRMDGVPEALPSWRRDPRTRPWDEADSLKTIRRKDSCRHIVLQRPGLTGPLAIRFEDREQRYVPRRIRIALPAPIGGGRQVRPALFPGAAYPLPAGVVGMRGRVTRSGAPLRWARVEARRVTDNVLVGRGQGDQHGEFVLILDAEASRGAELILPLRIRVTVFGPDTAPDPAAHAGSALDPLWDLPLEHATIDVAGAEVLAGERLPAGYVSRPGTIREVEFSWHGLVREEFDFS